MVICVSLRMTASAEAPSAPMELPAILQARGQDGNGERVGVSMGADTKANTRGGGALELGDSRLFEDGSERGGALVSDVVFIEAAKHGGGWGSGRRGVSMGADMEANTIWGGGALQLLEHAVPLDAARNDDGGGNDKPLA